MPFGLRARSYFKFMRRAVVHKVSKTSPRVLQDIKGKFRGEGEMWNRPATILEGAGHPGSPPLSSLFPSSSVSLALPQKNHPPPPPMRSHTWWRLYGRKEKKEMENTRGPTTGILRENPCHCLRRREEVLENVNSFRGNKHGRAKSPGSMPFHAHDL